MNSLTVKSLGLEEENKTLNRRIQLTEQKLVDLEKLMLGSMESTCEGSFGQKQH